MFHLKKAASLIAIAMICSLMALAVPALHAQSAYAASDHTAVAAVSCTYDGCNGKSPVSTGCSSTTVVTHQAAFSSHGGGYTEFVFSATCHAAWGFIHFNSAMASGHTGDAGIANDNGAVYLCEDGNGVVAPGQTSCYTAMVGDGPSETAWATGFYDTTLLSQTAAY
ncbi:MAG TPA: DUF2690 domain-containing protein [Dictyobacter sp.]|jgi:hypothetical protein|nr:DUF2690 domain-containing protein [Dictyobacter sp.]